MRRAECDMRCNPRPEPVVDGSSSTTGSAKSPNVPQGWLYWSSSWLWHMTLSLSGHLGALLSLLYIFPPSSHFYIHPSEPPTARLQLEVSGNLLTQAAIWAFLTAPMREPAEELRRNCWTSSISHQRQGWQGNLQAREAIQLVITEPLTSYIKGASSFLSWCLN